MDLREFFGPTVGVEKCEEDLGLNVPFVKGRQIPVRNCWHFFTSFQYCRMPFKLAFLY